MIDMTRGGERVWVGPAGTDVCGAEAEHTLPDGWWMHHDRATGHPGHMCPSCLAWRESAESGAGRPDPRPKRKKPRGGRTAPGNGIDGDDRQGGLW